MEGATGQAGLTGLTDFIREYKVLDCACCDLPIAFKHRVSGLIYCNPECIGRHQGMGGMPPLGTGLPPQLPPPLSLPPGLATPSGSRTTTASSGVEGNPPAPHSVKEELAAMGSKSKKQEVTIDHEMESTSAPDAVASASASAKALTPTLKPRIPPQGHGLSSAREEGDEGLGAVNGSQQPKSMLSAANLRRMSGGVNPFVRNFPTVASVSASLQRGQKEEASAGEEFVEEYEEDAALDSGAASARPIKSVTPQPQRFKWQNCSFSENLKVDNPIVKASFIYNIHKVHICADADEDALANLQVLIRDNIASGEAKKMTSPPALDEMVIADYENTGEHYRSRVLESDGSKVTLLFVDFGDIGKNIDYKGCYQMSRALMKVPIMGVPLRLDGVEGEVEKAELRKVTKKLGRIIYSTCTVKLLEKLEIGRKDSFLGRLTTVEDKKNVNELINQVAHDLNVLT